MPKASKSKASSTPVDMIRHKDSRSNIPTKELSSFMKDEESAPKVLRYPRDPSLDPQLVWKGKDEQDGADLEIEAVPVYIQEKIHPQAIIDDIKKRAQADKKDDQRNLFADFNGIGDDFEKRIDFYSHEVQAHWSNRMILGDSLLVMTSIAEKEGLRGKVQCIYFDPPYGIKFGSNWQASTRSRDVRDGKIEGMSREPEMIKAFRDTWALGIHSYLAYLRDRLVVAHDLLTETGSIFVQMGHENVHLVRCLLDEVFGSNNFVSMISYVTNPGFEGDTLSRVGDFVVWYGKNREHVKYRGLYLPKGNTELGNDSYRYLLLADGSTRGMSPEERAGEIKIPEGAKIYAYADLAAQGGTEQGSFDVEFEGKVFSITKGKHWATSQEGMKKLIVAQRLMASGSGNGLRYIRFVDDFAYKRLGNIWSDTMSSFMDKKYVVQTNIEVIKRCMLMTTDPGDLVLDPTCGSGSTAYIAEQWGRRWITIDTSRVALALARTRLMSARYPYYLLTDSPEGIKKEQELTSYSIPNHKTENDIRKGFVYKRIPHVTLGSIANNPDIKEGMSRAKIDVAIAKYTESEMLFDQPYEDNRRIRVCGPFTVESLSPHRMLSTDTERPQSEIIGRTIDTKAEFATIVIDNLKKSGVQNTKKKERLKFNRLEQNIGGLYVHAEGEYEGEGGKACRVGVSIGPEYGTLGTQHIKEAAKEAMKGIGYDLLIVCAYAFDPHVSEEVKNYGKLTVLPVRINADLSMGDELLKKTGSGNLFMVFGEPDIDIKKKKDEIIVSIRGLDIYDPTSGNIRSTSTDDIACWFIDTNYNGESFFVRHAYFTGANEPYDKLKRALRAEVDESAWQSLYSTTSRPFPKPTTGKIAVKVINHYGDEVLKVYSEKDFG